MRSLVPDGCDLVSLGAFLLFLRDWERRHGRLPI